MSTTPTTVTFTHPAATTVRVLTTPGTATTKPVYTETITYTNGSSFTFTWSPEEDPEEEGDVEEEYDFVGSATDLILSAKYSAPVVGKEATTHGIPAVCLTDFGYQADTEVVTYLDSFYKLVSAKDSVLTGWYPNSPDPASAPQVTSEFEDLDSDSVFGEPYVEVGYGTRHQVVGLSTEQVVHTYFQNTYY